MPIPLIALTLTAAQPDPRLAVRPSAEQLAWQRMEMILFVHFGVNTFTDREWGEGNEDPSLFNPTDLDCAQWAQVAREAGFGGIILTAKHHDGFCLWPSAYTAHSVASSPWREGRGDVVREFSDACTAAGIRFGFYLSPWDRNAPMYGDSPAYNEHFRNQLRELLTGYADPFEVWFDGANGEGPNGKRQEYDWGSYYALIRELRPQALIAICGPDVRWVGNESGVARETEWSLQQRGDEWVWYPAECDVSIRPGWFYHAAQDEQVKSLEQLLDIYFASVGRNSVLLLNVPPDRRGRFADPDVARLREFRAALDAIFADDLARRATPTAPAVTDGELDTAWQPAAGEAWQVTLEFDAPVTFNVSRLQEQIALGQPVEGYRLEVSDGDGWRTIVDGTTIGHKKLDRFARVTATRVRLTVTAALAPPAISEVGLYLAERWP